MSRTDVVLVKSFGDLVIAAAVAEHMPAAARAGFRLLVGEHLIPLLEAIGTSVPVHVLRHGEEGVPAMYDVRRCGRIAALRSAWRLRREIAAAAPSRLLFDQVRVRERWLSGSTPVAALPGAANIYLAYEGGLGATRVSGGIAWRAGDIGIFPGSRIAAKNLTRPIVEAAMRAIAGSGDAPRLMLLEGERPDLEASGLPFERVQRSLPSMVAAVSGCGAVVSADSMPAHVAEHRGIPVHVISPVDNRYWLPRSAFVRGRWSLFDADQDDAIGSFLTDIKKGDG